MAIIDDISKTFSDMGQATKDMAGIAKYNAMIIEEEKKASGLYEKIGRKHVNPDDDPSVNIDNLIDLVKECESKIAEYKETVRSLKGIQICTGCGAEIAQGAMFCSVCGTKVPEPDDGKTACKKCGVRVVIGSKFCTSCGQPMD